MGDDEVGGSYRYWGAVSVSEAPATTGTLPKEPSGTGPPAGKQSGEQYESPPRRQRIATPSSPTLATRVSTATLGAQVSGRPERGREGEAERAEGTRHSSPAGLSRSASDKKTVPASGRRVPGGHLALGEGQAEGAVDAHDLAGRAHLGPEQGVDTGEAVEGKHRLLDAHVVEHGTRSMASAGAALSARSSASVCPTITRAATMASGTPVAFATNGTVRLARGLASST